MHRSTTITGDGSLTVTATADSEVNYCVGIFIWGNYTLTIINTTVTAIGNEYGIRSNSNYTSKLTIDNSTVKATGKKVGSIVYINNLTLLNSCRITQPAGASFNASQQAVVDENGEFVKSQVVIEPESYDIYIAGIQLNSANKDDIVTAINNSGKAGVTVSGTMTYNPESNVLTLDGVNFSTANAIKVIENQIDSLTINLLNNNTLTSAEDVVVVNANTKISGTGTLSATTTGGNKTAIWHRNGTLTIENTEVTLSGVKGYYGNIANNTKLVVDNSTLRATGTSGGSITNCPFLMLNNAKITQPAGASFDFSQKAVVANGEIVKSQVAIEPAEWNSYNIYVAGVQVNDDNKNDLAAAINNSGQTDVSASGTITYAPETNMLTLNSANVLILRTIYAIRNEKSGLIINLIGENYLSSSDDAMRIDANTKITGTGSLNVTTTSGSKSAIWHRIDSLTLENTEVTLTGAKGYNGRTAGNTTLIITNSMLKSTGTGGSIIDCPTLTLNGCAITQPLGADFDASKKAVVDANGEIVKSQVVIEKPAYDLQVAGVYVTPENKGDITAVVNTAGQTATGIITYDPETNTLTLNNATIETDGDFAVHSTQPNGLQVNVIGDCSLTTPAGGIIATGKIGISGDTLRYAGNNYAIQYSSDTITINNCHLIADVKAPCISAQKLIAENCTIDLETPALGIWCAATDLINCQTTIEAFGTSPAINITQGDLYVSGGTLTATHPTSTK